MATVTGWTASKIAAELATKADVATLAETIRDTVASALTAGANVTITPNDGADTITITSSGGGSTDVEVVRDTIATALVAGSGITITPNDGADTITISSTGGGSTDPEVVRDTIATALVSGDGISIVADDVSNTITISLDAQASGPSGFVDVFEDVFAGGSGTLGVSDHTELLGLTSADAHPISSITGLETALSLKSDTGHAHGAGVAIASNRLLGRVSPSVGDPEPLTGAQAASILPTVAQGQSGLVPAISGSPSSSRVLTETGWREETGSSGQTFKGVWAGGSSYPVGSVVEQYDSLWRLTAPEPSNGLPNKAYVVESKKVMGVHSGTYNMPTWNDKRVGDKVVVFVGARGNGQTVSASSGLTNFHTDVVTTTSPAATTTLLGLYRDIGTLNQEPAVSITINGSSAPAGMVFLQWMLIRGGASGAPTACGTNNDITFSQNSEALELTAPSATIPNTTGNLILGAMAIRGSGAQAFTPPWFWSAQSRINGPRSPYDRNLFTVFDDPRFVKDHLDECNFGLYALHGDALGLVYKSTPTNDEQKLPHFRRSGPAVTLIAKAAAVFVVSGVSTPVFDQSVWRPMDPQVIPPPTGSLSEARRDMHNFYIYENQHLSAVLDDAFSPMPSENHYGITLAPPLDPTKPHWAAITVTINGEPKVMAKGGPPLMQPYPLMIAPGAYHGQKSTVVWRWRPQSGLTAGGRWHMTGESFGDIEKIQYKFYNNKSSTHISNSDIQFMYHPDTKTAWLDAITSALAAIPASIRAKVTGWKYPYIGDDHRYMIQVAPGINNLPTLYQVVPPGGWFAQEQPDAGWIIQGHEISGTNQSDGRVFCHEFSHAIDRTYAAVGTPITLGGQTANYTGHLSEHPAFLALHQRVTDMSTPWAGMNDRYKWSVTQPYTWNSIPINTHWEFFAETLGRVYCDAIPTNTDKSYINGGWVQQYTPPAETTLTADLLTFFTEAGLV